MGIPQRIGNMNVSLSHNYRMEMNREYASEVDTIIGSDADYNARKPPFTEMGMSMYTGGFSAGGCSADVGSEANIGRDAKQR